MKNDELYRLATDELTKQFHEYRAYTFDSSGNPKDSHYYSALYEADRRLIILLGEREHQVFSMADTRMQTYFEAAGRGLISGNEPRRFLEFLLEAKRYAVIEHKIDRKLIQIIDDNPDLKSHCFQKTMTTVHFLIALHPLLSAPAIEARYTCRTQPYRFLTWQGA